MSRILPVRDALRDTINEWWEERDDPENDEVLCPWKFPIQTAGIAGRKVVIFPSAYAGVPVTRAEDQDDYSHTILVVERYREQGDPPNEWIDERVNFCEGLLERVGNPRLPRLLPAEGEPNSGLWPQVAEMQTICDAEELHERKMFFAVLNVTYREHAE